MGKYKNISKESKGLLRGEYGNLPAPVNEEVRKLAIGDDEVITCRPADLLKPELENYTKELKEMGFYEKEEDVLSYALLPQVAQKFFEKRKYGTLKAAAPAQAANSASTDNNGVRTLYVEDLS